MGDGGTDGMSGAARSSRPFRNMRMQTAAGGMLDTERWSRSFRTIRRMQKAAGGPYPKVFRGTRVMTRKVYRRRDDAYMMTLACRCCGVGLVVPEEDAVDLCLPCLRGKGGDTNRPCALHEAAALGRLSDYNVILRDRDDLLWSLQWALQYGDFECSNDNPLMRTALHVALRKAGMKRVGGLYDKDVAHA